MRKLLVVALVASTMPIFGQGSGIGVVRGGADFSDGSLVGIPRGSIFTIEADGLAPSAQSASGLPLPVSLNGVSVRIWNTASGGNILAQCPLWYVSPLQINAVLPSSLAAGQYYLSVVTEVYLAPFGVTIPLDSTRVAFNATSGRFAPFSQGGGGFGPAVVQQYGASGGPILNRLTVAATPDATLVLWGTGLGPLPSGSDADSPQAGTIRNDITVYVDGLPATPVYAGRAPGLPGVDQINFVLPAGVHPRCFVPLQVATGSAASGVSTLAVSAGSAACASEFGLPPGTLASLDAGGVVRVAVLNFNSTTGAANGKVSQSAKAWEAEYDAPYLSALASAGQPIRAKGLAICGATDRSQGLQPVTGVALTPSISGMSGCSWFFSGNVSLDEGFAPAGCIGSSYSFASSPAQVKVSGALPPPRSASAITSYSVQPPGPQGTVSWTVNPDPPDGVTLVLGSSYTPPTLFGQPQTFRRELACQANVADTPFTYPQTDSAWALYYADAYGSMSLTTIGDQAFPQNNPLLDLVLVRVTNTVQALGTGN